MLNARNSKVTNFEPFLDKAINQISQLGRLHNKGSATTKRKIIGSIFPEKLTFKIINFEPLESMKN